MGPFDWLKRGRQAADPSTWVISRESGRLLVSDGKRQQTIELSGAVAVRLVPGAAVAGHGAPQAAGGWQVAIRKALGDEPVAWAVAEPRAAFALAERVCGIADLPMEETSRRLFASAADLGLRLDARP